MTPIRFGAPGRQLYGVLHPGHPQRQTSHSVLLCNPFGQEAVRLHRLYRVLADQLSLQGTNVLRFDYFGTGESGGEDEEGELEGWREDLTLADREMRQRLGATQITWVGARLGATLAAITSAGSPRPPDRLLLWEPILNGQAYLQELAWADTHALQGLMTPPPVVPRTAPGQEAIGFGIGASLMDQLHSLDTSPLSSARARQVHVVHSPDALADAVLKQAASRCSSPCQLVALRHTFDWTSEEALNTALVPADALKLLMSCIEGAVP
jgi:alpha-beta hydrolase superfamily lysophospholipase